VKAFSTGGVDYLTKPFQMEELHARVETHLKLRRLQIELENHSRDLEQARARIDLDMRWARGVQRSFLPQQMPDVPGYEFFRYYESAQEIGGDYYDFVPLPRQRIAVLLGDVAGKGVVAALLMAKLCAEARFCMLTEPDPAAAISKLNSLMNDPGIGDRFVTLVAAVLDPASHTVTLVNAGHPPPLLYRRAACSAADAISNDCAGVPLGVVEGFNYTSCEVSLEPGDMILAFTDGVTEAMDVQDLQLQTKGVYAAVEGKPYAPGALGDRVVKVVKQFSTGRSQSDDIALVGFGRNG
jgi:serine phosphatase RsbU (regulator of sigma subunit)